MQLGLAGKEVVLIEKGGLGGQCLHHGCMAVCALNDVARHLFVSRTLHSLGVLDSVPEVSFSRTLSGMREVQAKIASVLDAETRGCGVQIRQKATGRVDGSSLFVDGDLVETDRIVIATGSLPRIPDIPGIRLGGVYTPHTLSSMHKVPEHLLIIGGGIMAAEFAFIFQEFGADVTLASRSEFLKGMHPKLRELAERDLEGVMIREGCTVREIGGDDLVTSAVLETGKGRTQFSCDGVFIAAGLVPNSGMIAGIRKGQDGRIIVDRSMATSNPDVYACGDVTGSRCLTPVARHEGAVAAASILGRDPPPDCMPIPQSMNLASEYAFVERDGSGDEVAFGSPGPAGPGTFWSVPRGQTGMAGILVSGGSGEIGGVYTAGPAAGIIAAYHSFLMRLGVTVHDFDRFMEVHPMADGVYPLMKYASSRIRQGRRDQS
jgi:dihydrolipoamide dehydrogenase